MKWKQKEQSRRRCSMLLCWGRVKLSWVEWE